jgi:hypothetical protein
MLRSRSKAEAARVSMKTTERKGDERHLRGSSRAIHLVEGLYEIRLHVAPQLIRNAIAETGAEEEDTL